VRVAFDSRPAADGQESGRYARCLLQALHETAGEHDEIFETYRPRGAEVFHAPWVRGAMLHSPCPMVVTIHDVCALTRRSERLRGGGMHVRLRHLALQRATHVIVPSEAAAREAVAALALERERIVVIPEPLDPAAGHAAGLPLGEARQTGARSQWTWLDAARATWSVYADALARPERPCVSGLSRRLVVRAPREPSSEGS
jgi:hypothetical protein